MANVTITIPDVLVPRVKAAARGLFPQYVELSDADTFKAITALHWKMLLSNYESIAARDQSTIDAAGIG